MEQEIKEKIKRELLNMNCSNCGGRWRDNFELEQHAPGRYSAIVQCSNCDRVCEGILSVPAEIPGHPLGLKDVEEAESIINEVISFGEWSE